MKLRKFVIMCIVLLIATSPLMATHFEKIWSGNALNAFQVRFLSAKIGTTVLEDLVPGDEIAIFDGEYCVGHAVLTQTIAPNPLGMLRVNCSMQDGEGTRNGYISGNPITIKIWSTVYNLERTLSPANYQITSGTPIFSVNSSVTGNISLLDETLPVELSSFSATMTASNFVSIMWTSESESNLRGYHVLRANDNVLNSAIRITPNIISATNTSSTTEYLYEDREVAQATEYYYWLQSLENDGSMNYHGPISIKTPDAEIVPQLPQMTVLGSVYPNPFRTAERANFDVAVKEGETATLKIFNVKGQIVKQYDNLGAGKHNPQWDGKDMASRSVATGIYFYQLSSPSTHTVKKMVIIK